MLILIAIYCLAFSWPFMKGKSLKARWKGTRASHAEKLLLQFRHLILNHRDSIEIEKYKFYSSLAQNLISYRRELGSPLVSVLVELREGLRKDIRFEKKLSQSYYSGLGQMLMIILTTWSFVFISFQLAELRVTSTKLWMIFGLQLIGLLFYHFSTNYFKQLKFDFYQHYFNCLYHLQSLISIGASPTKALKAAKIGQLFELEKLPIIDHRLEQALELWRESGAPIREELGEILDETWFNLEQSFDSFSNSILLIRFVAIVCFFLSAYFFYLMEILGDMLVL
jgi:hypothetical protein